MDVIQLGTKTISLICISSWVNWSVAGIIIVDLKDNQRHYHLMILMHQTISCEYCWVLIYIRPVVFSRTVHYWTLLEMYRWNVASSKWINCVLYVVHWITLLIMWKIINPTKSNLHRWHVFCAGIRKQCFMWMHVIMHGCVCSRDRMQSQHLPPGG